jgi:hypothetical protein
MGWMIQSKARQEQDSSSPPYPSQLLVSIQPENKQATA